MVEYISDPKVIGAKTLFATHYHELTQLEGQLKGVKNYCVTIKENGDSVVFLHKIQRGSGDQSYGIEVAKLAGLPHWVLDRAHSILAELLGRDVVKKASEIKVVQSVDPMQENLFDSVSEASPAADGSRQVVEELKNLDVNRLTPLEAMQLIYDWQQKLTQ